MTLAGRALAASAGRWQAVLKEIQRWRLSGASPALIKSLEDRRPEVRASTAEAIAFLTLTDAGPALIPLLKDESREVRGAVCNAVGELRLKSAGPELARLLGDEDAKIRLSAVRALGKIRSEIHMSAVVALLADGDRDVVAAACVALGEMGAKDAASKLVPLLGHRRADVSVAAFQSLSMMKAVDQISALVPFLKDEESWRRNNAIIAISNIQGMSAGPTILPMLRDSDPTVREMAIHALARQVPLQGDPIPELIDSLMDTLTKDRHPTVRAAAGEALSAFGFKKAIPGILPLLRSDDFQVRRVAVAALGRLDAVDHVADLLPLLKDDEPRVRVDCAISLCHLQSKEGVPLLMKAAEIDRGADSLCHLNALYNRKIWSLLNGIRAGVPPRKKREEILAEAARAGGLGLELPERPEDRDDDWASVGSALSLAHWTGAPLGSISYLDWLDDAISIVGYTYILEERTLRVVTAKEGLKFWKRWLDQ